MAQIIISLNHLILALDSLLKIFSHGKKFLVILNGTVENRDLFYTKLFLYSHTFPFCLPNKDC